MERKGDATAAAAGPARTEGESQENGDLISGLPDDILGTIISLLHTKDGGRTQALSRRWRHLWRSAPLNLEVRTCHPFFFPTAVPHSAVSKIISEHPGPARRFSFPGLMAGGDLFSELESWLRSPALANLQELCIRDDDHFSAPRASSYPLLPLPCLLPSASTLLVLTISHIKFPDQLAPYISFPLLKQLSLVSVSISEDVFHGLLSGCHALESLLMSSVRSTGCLRVSSSTLRSISLGCKRHGRTELVIHDTPRLERLLLRDLYRGSYQTIRIMRVPELKILGTLSPDFSRVQVFQGPSPVSLANSMRSIKVLAVLSSNAQLNAVLSVLVWFPCLEKLYVSFCDIYWMKEKIEPRHDPLHPIECLRTHLKKVVLRDYSGHEQQIDFARFFVLNAKVLNKIEFEGREPAYDNYNTQPVAYQHRLLQVENRASRDAQFEIRSNCGCPENHLNNHIHDLSVGDPFKLVPEHCTDTLCRQGW